MIDQSLITFRVPKPHVDIDESVLNIAENNLKDFGYRVMLVAEENYPVSASWAEIAIAAGSFFAGGVATHYLDKILDVFDAFVKKNIDVLNLCISSNGKSTYRDIQLRDRELAKKALSEAFFEISVGLERANAIIYWFEKAAVTENGVISFETSGWRDGGKWSSLNNISVDSADYEFWAWLLNVSNLRKNITDKEIVELKNKFNATQLATTPVLTFSPFSPAEVWVCRADQRRRCLRSALLKHQ